MSDNDWKSGNAPPDDTAWNDNFGGGNEWNEDDATKSTGDDKNMTAGEDGITTEACRNCGELGHFARECPEPKKLTGECFNCGEIGHNKADCTNPRVARPFTGECRRCGETGHPAAECPQKPPTVCKNCLKEGHVTSECKDARVLKWEGVPADWDAEMAWAKLVEADKEKDLDGFRTALKAYASKVPTDFVQIETTLREDEMNVYLIGLVREVPKSLTIVDLVGNVDRKYVIGFYFSQKPRRVSAVETFPKTPEENLERLQNAGFLMDRMVPQCSRCGEMGHTAKGCKQEYEERADKVEIKCAICQELGHRARDCTQERVDPFMCRNCKESGHKASDCPNPRDLSDIECKNCNKMGHFAKDCEEERVVTCRNCGEKGHMSKECDKPRNMDNVKCNNCEELGHFSKQCPKPRDYSKVQCTNCQEYGHTKVRCPKPEEDEDNEPNGVELNAAEPATGLAGDWDNGNPAGPANDAW